MSRFCSNFDCYTGTCVIHPWCILHAFCSIFDTICENSTYFPLSSWVVFWLSRNIARDLCYSKRERDRPYAWRCKNCELFLQLTASAFKGKVILITFSLLLKNHWLHESRNQLVDADYTSNQVIPGNLQMYVSTNRSPLQYKTLPAHFSNNLMVYCSLNVIY